MSCNCVVVTGTSGNGSNTTVSWRSPTVTGLEKFLITFSQAGELKNFEAAAEATSVTAVYTATTGCTVTVTPKDANGPVISMSSATTPVPFPPQPPDPELDRPVTVRVCADTRAGTLQVDWLSSTISYLEGYILTIVEGTSSLKNFDVPGADAVTTTVQYVVDPTKQFSIILTPYDDLSPVKTSASYPVSLPYPGPPPAPG